MKNLWNHIRTLFSLAPFAFTVIVGLVLFIVLADYSATPLGSVLVPAGLGVAICVGIYKTVKDFFSKE